MPVSKKLLEGLTKDQESSSPRSLRGSEKRQCRCHRSWCRQACSWPRNIPLRRLPSKAHKFLPDVIVVKIGIGGTSWCTGGWIPAIKSKVISCCVSSSGKAVSRIMGSPQCLLEIIAGVARICGRYFLGSALSDASLASEVSVASELSVASVGSAASVHQKGR